MPGYWDGRPEYSVSSERRMHVLSSRLGRNPTVYYWDPNTQSWENSQTQERLTPAQVTTLGMTYEGTVMRWEAAHAPCPL